MKFNIRLRLYIGFTLAVLLVLMVGYLSYITFNKQHREAETVKQSYQVIQNIQYIQLLLINMETGRRGFRLTNENHFLQPYQDGLSALEPSLDNLQKLIAHDANQVANFRELKIAIEDLLAFWRNLRPNTSTSNNDVIELMNSEKERMAKIRSKISEMSSIENTLLSDRENGTNTSVNRALDALVIGISLILFIVVVLIYFIIKAFNSRQKAEDDLKENNKQLIQANEVSKEKNWILGGLAKVNESLHGNISLKQLNETVLDLIIKYLDRPSGAFYLFNEQEGSLNLEASYAIPETHKKYYKLREGWVGQAATEAKPLLIKDVPTAHLQLQSGIVKADPANILYVPYHVDGELKGVMELLGFSPFTEGELELLSVTSNNIAVAMHSAQAREKVWQLLEQVQQQKEVLENQQEELRQTNEELSLQAEVLQASEEELKVQEEELRQINSELEEKNEALETSRKAFALKANELQLTSKFKSEFLANMSHELRTPLNSILILARLLADNLNKNLNDKQVAHAKIIYKSGSDLLQLINDILDLSKIEAGKLDVNIDEISVSSIATDMEQLFTVVAQEKKIDFSIKIDDAVPPTIKTDKQKVEQILKNLLSNAFKFTPKNGSIELSFKLVQQQKSNYIAMLVKDNGIGIPKEKQPVIFNAFQQADGATNRKYGGTGLGLSIIKELTRLLKGQVNLQSEEGQGSTFTILIPATGDATIESERNPEIKNELPVIAENVIPEQTKVADDRNNIKPGDNAILIIEDDEDFAKLLRVFALEKGYKAIVALQGDEGLHYAQKYKPSAIILDMKLPVISGAAILQKLKKDAALKNIPVHVISGGNDFEKSSSGILAYLEKPVDKQDIEKAFTLIGEYLHSSVKKVLLLSEESLKNELLQKLKDENHFDIQCDFASTIEGAQRMIRQQNYDCVIADIGKNVDEGIINLRSLHEQLQPKSIPIIIYLDNDITKRHEIDLKRISDVVVRKSSLSNNRLLDELELFLYKVEEDNSKPEMSLVPHGTSDSTLVKKKVLLVDDDMRNVFALSAALEQEQMLIVTANDGKEALTVIEEDKNIDIVLMDIMMPEMDGYEAMRHIRNVMKKKDLPIIALTAKAMVGDREKCIEAGASDYITKPVDVKKLTSLIRVWLS